MPNGKTKNTATEKKTTRRKKAAEPVVEAVAAEQDAVQALPDAVTSKMAETSEVPAPKKRGRKPKTEAAASETPKKRGRKPKAETAAETVAPAEELVSDPVLEESKAAEAPVEVPAAEVPAEVPAEEPVKKRTRKPRAAKKPAADAEPKKRGRKPKPTGPVLTTTLQIGDAEFDISDIAQNAYKEYKRVHKRKVITDFHVYVKPEEGAAYFTINGEGSEDFKINLK